MITIANWLLYIAFAHDRSQAICDALWDKILLKKSYELHYIQFTASVAYHWVKLLRGSKLQHFLDEWLIWGDTETNHSCGDLIELECSIRLRVNDMKKLLGKN